MPTGDEALAANPYDWQPTKAGPVLVFRDGRRVDTIGGKDAARLLARLEQAEAAGDDARVQHLLARATGHYKHGNER